LRWIRLLLDTESATVLLSLGRGPLSLAQDLYDAHRDIQHVHITDASEPYEVLKASLLPKDTRVIVLVDVIGTQRSLNGLLEGCQHLNIVHLIGVVDSRYEAEEKSVTYLGKQYGLETIVRLPIRFWYEDKPPHYRYEQIIRVDPLSNAPITEPFLAEQPIWKTLNVVTGENTLLTEALADGSAIMVGHFENNDRHILYLFSTSRLAELYGTAIADTIRVDFTSYVDRDPALRELGDVKILYPKFTPGAEAIAQQISAALRYCPVIGLSSRQVRAAGLFGPKREAFRHVIIFDDASTTGTTLRHMLDLAERNGARTVFMYILCNRAETADARFLKNIQLYGRSKVHVRYLSDLPIPTYSRTQCPICRRAALYVQLKSELHDCPRVVYAIDELLLDLQKHPVDMLLDPTFALTYLSTPVPERLLMWELRSLLELAKQSVPVRKRLADVARDLHDVNSHALYLIRVIAAEEASFTEDERFMKEVFYESFRKALVTACRFYLKDRSSLLTTNDLAALLTVGRMFNRSFVAEQFEELERYWASEQNLMIMVVQLLLSVDRRTDIARVRDALRNIPTEHRSATIETLVQYFAGRAERATASHATLTAYQACIMRLADHGKLASLFAAIDPEKLSTLNSTKLSEIVEKYWREASSLIASDILPPIRVLTESGMAKSVCEDLRQVLLKVTALVKNTEELAGFVVNPRDSNVNRSIALDGFQRGVVEVQTILLEEEALSVPTLMLRLRAELGRIVVRVLDGYSARFAHDGVVVKYSPPSDSVFVLGHESDIFTILRNLIENVLLRAFESTHSVTPREAEIAIHGTEGDLDIALSVSDNGKGVPVNLKYGAGLSTIDEIVRKIGSKWSVGPRIDGRLGTYANVVFYRLPKR